MAFYFKVGKSELKRMSYTVSRSANFVRITCNGKTVYYSRLPFLVFGKRKSLHKPIDISVGIKEKNKLKIAAEFNSSRLVGTLMGKIRVTVLVDGKNKLVGFA